MTEEAIRRLGAKTCIRCKALLSLPERIMRAKDLRSFMRGRRAFRLRNTATGVVDLLRANEISGFGDYAVYVCGSCLAPRHEERGEVRRLILDDRVERRRDAGLPAVDRSQLDAILPADHDAVSLYRAEAWALRMRLAGYRREAVPDMWKVVRGDSRRRPPHDALTLPRDDHSHMWVGGHKERIYTAQPYDLGGQDVLDIRSFCGSHGLAVRFSEKWSWWSPGKTTLVVVATAGAVRDASLSDDDGADDGGDCSARGEAG